MAKQLHLLILDDEPIVGRRLAPALNKLGCEIEAFEDPERALKRMEEKGFQIVVTDVRMGKHRWLAGAGKGSCPVTGDG